MMPGGLLCLSELVSGDETVEPPGLPVSLPLSCPQRLLISVLTPLFWKAFAGPLVGSESLSPWVVTLALQWSKLLGQETQSPVMALTGTSYC